MKAISGMIKRFRFKSIFVSQLALILACCMVLCGAFSLYFVRVSVQSSAEHQKELNQEYVDTLVGNMEYLVEELEQSLTQLSYSRNIASMIYTGSFDEDVAGRIMSDVALTSNNNLLVEKALLYIPERKFVIGDNYKGYELDDSPYSQLIRSYDSGQIEGKVVESGTKRSRIFTFNGQTVIARDFPLFGKNRLATLYYMIDMRQVYRQLTGEIMNGSRLLVYDEQGYPLFENEISYPAREKEQELPASGEEGSFLGISDKLGWVFLYQTDAERMRVSGWKMFWKICPAMLVILSVVSVLSFFSASRMYRPINQLLSTLESRKIASDIIPSLKNELDYLEWTFSELMNHQEELDALMRDVSNDIMTRFFYDCLSGTQITYADSKKILASAGSAFQSNAYYVVCVVETRKDENASVREDRENLQQILKIFERKREALFHILEINDAFTVILSFEESRQALNIQKELGELKKMFFDSVYFQKRDTVIGIGRLYRSILDVGFSYHDAMKHLAKGRQQLPDSEKEEQGTERQEAASMKPEQIYEERAHQVFRHVENGDADSARILVSRTAEEIETLLSEKELQQEAYKAFVGALLSDVTSLEYADFSRFSGELQQDPFRQLESRGGAELADEIKSWCGMLIEELDKMFKKQQNRYLVAAQEYINTYYSDPNLSLNTIAEAIHVNPSYLSKLFKNSLGVYFTDYLNKVRVNYSVTFLTDTDKTVKEIAGECGYGSVQNYIRVFKKYMNQSPGQYRDAFRQRAQEEK